MNPFARRTYGTLERVTERVYLFRNVVNSVIVLGDEAIAVIDTQVNAPMAERLLLQARTLSDKPLRYAINTHYHWDHTAGNHVCKRRRGHAGLQRPHQDIHGHAWRQATGLPGLPRF